MKYKMKLNVHKLTHIILLALSVMFFLPGQAAETNNSFLTEVVNVEADQQEFDIENNKAIFSGNVIIKQGKMIIRAARAVVTSNNQKPAQQTIEFQGNPVKFENTLEDGRHIKGHAQRIIYNSGTSIIELHNKAFLDQEGNTLLGEFISYNLNKKNVIASGKKNGDRIKSVILPAQLNNKK